MKRPVLLAAIVVAGSAAAVYVPVLGGELVYDDRHQILIDDYIHHPANLAEVLSLRVLGRDVLDHNRPVMLASLMIDSIVWGRNPLGYHLTSVGLHAACSVLVLVLLRRVFIRLGGSGGRRDRPLIAAGVGAMIFAVHPANSEAVCAAAFREDVLATLFVLIALLLADRLGADRPAAGVLLGAGCVAAALAAAASKETGAVAPAMLAAYWLIVRRRAHARTWAVLIAAAALAVGAFIFARFALEPDNSVIFAVRPRYVDGSFGAMLKVQPRIWAFQLRQIIFPNLLCADQTDRQHHLLDHIPLAVALAGLAAAVAVTAIAGRKNPAIYLAAALYCLAVAPVSNFIPMYRPLADRYLYLPMVAVALAVGAVVCRWKRRFRPPAVVAAAAICAALGAVTVGRAIVWREPIRLWTDAARTNPYSHTAHDNLGFALFEAGRFGRAETAFRRANELNPASGDPLAGLAITCDATGRQALAERYLRTAILLDARYADPPGLVRALLWPPELAEKLQAVADRIDRR